MTDASSPSASIPDVEATSERFEGHWLIFRKNNRNLSRKIGGSHLPYFRHGTFEKAEAEAKRLIGLYPESTFIIMQEQATVKVRQPASPDNQEDSQ